ncbi:MAG TPA: hypothetical protein VEC12_13605 [Bacteroidia bacterium]|nr:hypothetical protein [Bacteroidia bacterium]
MNKIFYPLIALAFLLPAKVYAQPSIGFYFNGSYPLGKLKNSGYRNGAGISFEFISGPVLKNRRNSVQMRIGGGFEFLNYGSAKVKDLVFNTPNNDLGYVTFKNSMSSFYLGPKFVFNAGGVVRPYIDVFGAVRGFNTTLTSTFNEEIPEYERSTSKRLLRNTVAHYGASTGLLIGLTRRMEFDLRFSYSRGGSIKFAGLNTVGKDPDFESNYTYREIKSPVSDVFIFRLGLSIKLGPLKDKKKSSSSAPAYQIPPDTSTKTYTNPKPAPPPKPAPVPPTPPKKKTEPAPEPPKPAPATPEKKKPAEVKPVPKPKPEPEEPPINY